MHRTPTRRRWRRLGWILVTPLLMGESFCPATCSSAFMKGIDTATSPIPRPAWTVEREARGGVVLTAAAPRLVREVTVTVGNVAAGQAPLVQYALRVLPPAPLKKPSAEALRTGDRACYTKRGPQGYPPSEAAYPVVDEHRFSTYLQATFTGADGQPLSLGRGCGAEYECSYGANERPACSGYLFTGTFSTANPKSMTFDPATKQYAGAFRVALAATDPAGEGYDGRLWSGVQPWVKGHGYETRYELVAKIVGPTVTGSEPKPPQPTLEVGVRAVE